MMNENVLKRRYARQIQVDEIGEKGQQKILQSSVLVIGAGGLGCPALQYLAGAGIGKLGLVDFDRVELSNLHRQLLYTEADIGELKVNAAARKLADISAEIKLELFSQALTCELASRIFPEYDLIIDGTDQIPVRYLINDACRLYHKPWVYGSVNAFDGQWALFHPGSADYRDLFPVPPNPMTTATCELTGTLGMIPGTVGTLQALEAVKYLTGFVFENALVHTLNFKNYDMYSIEILPADKIPLSESEFLNTDYLQYVMGFHYGEQGGSK